MAGSNTSRNPYGPYGAQQYEHGNRTSRTYPRSTVASRDHTVACESCLEDQGCGESLRIWEKDGVEPVTLRGSGFLASGVLPGRVSGSEVCQEVLKSGRGAGRVGRGRGVAPPMTISTKQPRAGDGVESDARDAFV